MMQVKVFSFFLWPAIFFPLPIFSADIVLEKIADGLDKPLFFAELPGTKERLVVEQGGEIRILKDGAQTAEPFLDLSKAIEAGGEKGLLGLAFHPKYERTKKFYVNYTYRADNLKTRISEFRVSKKTNRGVASPTSSTERVILEFDQPFDNHNGGHLEFGPDGFLYIATGDGGSAGDPEGNAQNLKSLLGKILRIDIDKGNPYAIPAGNPFRNVKTARPEIWAYGLRNPWRFCFDRATGLLYAADVGQDKWEEIDLIQKGKNYGWNMMEGTHLFKARKGSLALVSFQRPILEYDHSEGESITGGYVYRGKKIKSLSGYYIYGDYESGKIWMLKLDGEKVSENKLLKDTDYMISSFGVDLKGEIYVVDHNGAIYQLVEK
jgi:glucose/arabinose dehydrogenase